MASALAAAEGGRTTAEQELQELMQEVEVEEGGEDGEGGGGGGGAVFALGASCPLLPLLRKHQRIGGAPAAAVSVAAAPAAADGQPRPSLLSAEWLSSGC